MEVPSLCSCEIHSAAQRELQWMLQSLTYNFQPWPDDEPPASSSCHIQSNGHTTTKASQWDEPNWLKKKRKNYWGHEVCILQSEHQQSAQKQWPHDKCPMCWRSVRNENFSAQIWAKHFKEQRWCSWIVSSGWDSKDLPKKGNVLIYLKWKQLFIPSRWNLPQKSPFFLLKCFVGSCNFCHFATPAVRPRLLVGTYSSAVLSLPYSLQTPTIPQQLFTVMDKGEKCHFASFINNSSDGWTWTVSSKFLTEYSCWWLKSKQ